MPSDIADRDTRLALLLEHLADEQRQGRSPDLDAVAAKHPDIADELKSLWATAQFADAFVRQTLPFAPAPTENGLPLPREFGDYELLEEIGRGGMGVVYKARQKSLNRMVALKMVRDPQLASQMDRARFQGEAESVARLKHVNIVTVHEVGEFEGQAYFCMEYIEGETLAQKLSRGPMAPREAARLVATIARAVQHAHDHGILHRDLKPSNVLLSGSLIKLTDFGLAKRVSGPKSIAGWKTQTGAIVGTPSYMAPEQAAGGRVALTAATDVYSLGAILYECLTNRPPFQGENTFELLMQVLEQEPVPPRFLNPKVDRDLEMICLKCLQKPMSLRYSTASNLAADLDAYAAGESLSTSPSGLRQFFMRMLRPTHHAAVLENWGLLWMWHSLQIFLLCFLTQILAWNHVTSHMTYLLLWTIGLGTWGAILWRLRRRAGPVLFVERQIAHAWAAGVCASIGMFIIEVLIPLPALTLSPAIAISAAMVFIFKAGILSGEFYLMAALNFATAVAMPLVPEWSILLFGIVSAVCFFVPGLKYYRQRKLTER